MVTFEQRDLKQGKGINHKDIWEKRILGRENNVFKGSEAGSLYVQEIVMKSS